MNPTPTSAAGPDSGARIRSIRSRFVLFPAENVDTDQIIPARFLTTTERSGLGSALFADRRGAHFPLDRPEAAGAAVLVGGANFGCGSSREHAVWALADAGFRAVIAPSFGDIFRENAQKNGLVPAALAPSDWRRLIDAARANPTSDLEVEIDLERCVVILYGAEDDGPPMPFPLDPFARRCLLLGVDELGFLLARLPEIEAFEQAAERSAA